jgi:CysZ protein
LGPVVWGAILAALAVFGAATAVVTFAVPLIPDGDAYGLGWLWGPLRLIAGAGIVVVALFLVPPITMFVGGLLFSQAKERIEIQRLGVASTGAASPIGSAVAAVQVSMPSFITNLAFLPAWAVPVLNIVGFIVINAFVSGRAYFDLAAGDQAKTLKARHGGAIFFAGVPIAVLMLIPAAQFLAPAFGAAVMTRLRHRLDPTLSAPPAPPASAPPPPPTA